MPSTLNKYVINNLIERKINFSNFSKADLIEMCESMQLKYWESRRDLNDFDTRIKNTLAYFLTHPSLNAEDIEYLRDVLNGRK